MKRFLIPLILLSLTLTSVSAQERSDVDKIFSEFDRKDHPAVAALILRNGEVWYQKAFGSRNLEYTVPAQIDTKFQLAGMSKHFTAFAIFLLEEEGKLDLSDDIRAHLPWLPEYPETITIDNLLSLTSGLPDIWSIKRIAGWDSDDVFTQKQAREIIKNLQPVFKPGEDYIYSNTDQVLLAEIVTKVSGQSFSNYLDQNLFAPLKMSNTLVVIDHEQSITNLAQSYEPDESGGFKPSVQNYGIQGPTNVYSTIEDLAKWELNLKNPVVGSEEMIRNLYTLCQTNDGNIMEPVYGRISYAQQFEHRERGLLNMYQIGSLGGYASSMFKFSEEALTVIILSSGIPYNGYLGIQSAYLLLEDRFTEPGSIDYSKLKSKKLKAVEMEKLTGIYWNDRSGYSRTIALKNDTLRYVRGPGNESSLIPLSERVFQMISLGDEKVMVSFEATNQGHQMAVTIGESAPLLALRKPAYTHSTPEMEGFTGTFYCDILKIAFELSIQDDALVARNLKESITLKPIAPGLFEGDQWFFGSIQFDQGKNGFHLQTEEVPKLWFRKI